MYFVNELRKHFENLSRPAPLNPEMKILGDRWKQITAASKETSTNWPSVYMVTLARDLTRTIHSERSRALVQGKKGEAAELEKIECDLENLRSKISLDLEKTNLETKWEEIYELSKTNRVDRVWEKLMVRVGVASQWTVLRAEIQVPVLKIQSLPQLLTNHYWPHATILFSEPLRGILGKEFNESWSSNWWFLRNPSGEIPDPLSFTSVRNTVAIFPR